VLRFVKIYGERNSGTTYLTELIEANFAVQLLPGTKRIPDEIIAAQIRGLPEPRRTEQREAIIDADLAATINENFGWKHSAPPLDTIKRERTRASQALFITVARHPYSWFDSMYRKPYHDLLPKSDSMERFLRREWKPVARDNLGERVLKNPVDLWNRKMAAYFALDKLPIEVLHLRHEEFLEEFETAMGKLAAKLPRKAAGPWVQIDTGTKATGLSYEDYAKRAKAHLPGASLSPQDLAFINRAIDRDLVAKLGYSLREA
jgi:hypothetical protein